MAEESIFLLGSYDKTLLADGNVFVFYDIRSNVQDAYEGANIMDRFMKSWYGDPFLQTNIKRLTNFNFTPSHPTNYNKWGKDW